MSISGKNIIALKVFGLIKKQAKQFQLPLLNRLLPSSSPYKILVSCILSLRTKDKVTQEASVKLFNLASTAQGMLKLPIAKIKGTIYPVGFYRKKARVILSLSKKIIDDFGGRVPSCREDLLSLKGVGRKTANLVLGLGFNIPAICVDTHVHRISNRLGWVKSKSPEETEIKLMKIFPKSVWIELNEILVSFGQNLCLPVSPFCSKCLAGKFCKRIGVLKSR
ncbi:MAG: endonuclease III [Candidatus Omnitrophota bacterium]